MFRYIRLPKCHERLTLQLFEASPLKTNFSIFTTWFADRPYFDQKYLHKIQQIIIRKKEKLLWSFSYSTSLRNSLIRL